jgi:hypothetical protein
MTPNEARTEVSDLATALLRAPNLPVLRYCRNPENLRGIGEGSKFTMNYRPPGIA